MGGSDSLVPVMVDLAPTFLRLLGIADVVNPRLTFICGAGISYPPPATLPTVGAFIASAVRHCTNDPSIHEAILRTSHDSNGPTPRFEVLVNAISQLGVKPASVGAIFDAVSPNSIHRFIAAQCEAGAAIITTNFDNCIERALQEPSNRVVFRGLDLNNPGSLQSVIVKPHGSNAINSSDESGDLVITIRELARTAKGFRQFPVWREYLRSLLRDRTVVIIGYSGSDDFDITPILLESEARYVVWVDYEGGILPHKSELSVAAAAVQHICSLLPSIYLRGDISELVQPFVAQPPHSSTQSTLTAPQKVSSWFQQAFPTNAFKQALLCVLFRHYSLHQLTVQQTELPLSTEVLVQRGTALYYLGRYPEARDTLQQAASNSPTPLQQGQILFLLSSALSFSGDLPAARTESQHYVALAEHQGDMGELQTALVHAAALAYKTGDLEEAQSQYQRVLDLQTQYASLQSAAMATWGLADVANARGQANEAYDGYLEACELCRLLGSGQGVAWLSANLGELLLRGRHFIESRTYLKESIMLFENFGVAAGLLYALACRAQLEYCLNETGVSEATLTRCLPLLSENPGSEALSIVLLLSYVLAHETNEIQFLERAKNITSSIVRRSAPLHTEGEARYRWKLCSEIVESKHIDGKVYTDCRTFLLGLSNGDHSEG